MSSFLEIDENAKWIWKGKNIQEVIQYHWKLHNLKGPAVEYLRHDCKQYWLDGDIYNNYLEYIQAVIKYKKDNDIS